MSAPLQLGVLLSGRGSNLQAIMEAIAEKRLPAELKVVVSNVAAAPGLTRAAAAEIPTAVVDHRRYDTRAAFEHALIAVLRAHDVHWVALAGFMRLLTREFLDAFPQRVINIHPALLPAFPGVHAQKQALDYGVKFSGCTVHFVDQGTDTGPIIAQAIVPVADDDTEETLASRILAEEHRLYPDALALLAQGRLVRDGRRVRLRLDDPRHPLQ